MKKLSFACNIHPEEVITNFCCLRNCLTPLCPDCIDNHIKKHTELKQVPEIDTLNRVKKMCFNKLNYTMESLNDDLERLTQANNINTN